VGIEECVIARESLKDLPNEIYAATGNKKAREAAIDALWFSRPSHNKGEAWNLGCWPRRLTRFFNVLKQTNRRKSVLKQ